MKQLYTSLLQLFGVFLLLSENAGSTVLKSEQAEQLLRQAMPVDPPVVQIDSQGRAIQWQRYRLAHSNRLVDAALWTNHAQKSHRTWLELASADSIVVSFFKKTSNTSSPLNPAALGMVLERCIDHPALSNKLCRYKVNWSLAEWVNKENEFTSSAGSQISSISRDWLLINQ